MTIFYSDVEPLSKYSPVMLQFLLLVEFLTKTLLVPAVPSVWARGRQFPPSVAMGMPPANFIGRTRKIEPKELPSYLSLPLLT